MDTEKRKEVKHQWYLRNKDRLSKEYKTRMKSGSPKSRYLVRCGNMNSTSILNAVSETAKHLPTKGVNPPSQNMKRWDWLEKKGIVVEKISLINNCTVCGADISDKHGNTIRCDECDLEERKQHNEHRLEVLRNKRKNGSANNTLGSHMMMKDDGSPDFKKELRKVEREMKRVFRYGGQLSTNF